MNLENEIKSLLQITKLKAATELVSNLLGQFNDVESKLKLIRELRKYTECCKSGGVYPVGENDVKKEDLLDVCTP